MNWSDEEELLQKLRVLGKQGYPRQGYTEKLRLRLHQEMNKQKRKRRNFQMAMMTGMTVASFFLTIQLLTPPSPSQQSVWQDDRAALLEEKRKLIQPLVPPPIQMTDQKNMDRSERTKQPVPPPAPPAPPASPPSPKTNQQPREVLNTVTPPETVRPVDPIQMEVAAYLGELLERDNHDYLPLEELSDRNRGRFVYTRTINGVTVLGESVTVVVDGTGNVTGAGMTSNNRSVPIEQFPDPSTAMPKAEAEKLIANAMQLEYKVRGRDGKPELIYLIPNSRILQANTGTWIGENDLQEVEGRVIDVLPKGMPRDVAELDEKLLFVESLTIGQRDSYEEDELKEAIHALETYLPSYVTQLRLVKVTKDDSELRFFFTWLHQGIPVDRNYVIALDVDQLLPVGLSGFFEQDPPALPDKEMATSPEDALQIYTGQNPLTLVYIPSPEEQQDSLPVLAYTFLKQNNNITTINAITPVLEP